MLQRLAVPLVCTIAAILSGCGSDGSNVSSNSDAKFSVAVIGDAPYGGSPTDTAEFAKNPAFINAINNDKDVSLVLHAGDIHSGKEYCTQAYDVSIFNQWSAFKLPLIYTPGDNEWTDCHKKKQGGGEYDAATGTIVYVTDPVTKEKVSYAGGDPVANLEFVRKTFFSTPGKSLGSALDVHSQALEYDTAYPSDKAYVENVWYEKSGVLFVTANIPGGSNNGTDVWYKTPAMGQAQKDEVANRTAAALRWLDIAFKRARDNGDRAVVIMEQADMWDLDGLTMADQHLTEYKQYIDKLVALTTAFAKPVLLINGDSHFYRSDNPLAKGAECKIEIPSAPIGSKSIKTDTCTNSVASGVLKGISNIADPYGIVQMKGDLNYVPSYNVSNFHRLVMHGNATAAGTDMEYIKLTIDPNANAPDSENAFGPFSWSRVLP